MFKGGFLMRGGIVRGKGTLTPPPPRLPDPRRSWWSKGLAYMYTK